MSNELPSKIPDFILRPSRVCEPPRSFHGVNIVSPVVYPKSKLSAEMSQLQVPTKGLRKRVSSEAVKESGQSRKKVAFTPQEKEIDMGDTMAEIKEIAEARRKTEKQARDDGMRVDKKARMRPRPLYCTCEGRPGVKRDGTRACGHIRCPQCLILRPDAS